MSYILDALRKSAAERERGMALGPNTPTPESTVEALAAARRTQMAFYGAVGLALLLLGTIVWLLLTRPAPMPTMASTTPDAAPVAAPTQPAPAQAVQVPTPVPAPVPAPEAVVIVTESIPEAVPPAPTKLTLATKPKPPRVKDVQRPAPLVTVPTAGSEAPPVYAVSELPDEVRATLPKLVISGAVYAETPANRMLIVSGQVFRENDEPAPGLQVEHIRPKEAILKYQGYRYRQSYP